MFSAVGKLARILMLLSMDREAGTFYTFFSKSRINSVNDVAIDTTAIDGSASSSSQNTRSGAMFRDEYLKQM